MSDTPKAEVDQLRNQLDSLRATDPTPHVEAAKQRVSDKVSGAAASVSDTVAGSVRQGADMARDAAATARRTAAQVGTQADSLTRQVRGQPFVALGAAVVAGYVFGRIVR